MGYQTIASDSKHHYGMGYNCIWSFGLSNGAQTMGNNTDASGYNGTAMGYSTDASGYDEAIGHETISEVTV